LNNNYSESKFKFSPRSTARTARQEGVGGRNAEPSERIQKEASPAALLVKAKHHRKILFSLGEEIRRAQNEKSKEYFSVVRRALGSGGGAASFVRIGLVKSSDFVQETQPSA